MKMDMDILRVGNLSAYPGQSCKGWLEIPNSTHSLPVTLMNGKEKGKTITIMAGTHGSEYVGIEAVIRISQILNPEELHGQVVLVHLVNQEAFFQKAQYINPQDGKNLGGIYPASDVGEGITISDKIAATIAREIIAQSDFHIDLHGGDLFEDLDSFGWFDTSAKTKELSVRAAELMGSEFMSFTTNDASALGMAARMGVPAISPEVGGCGRWDEKHVQQCINGILNIMKLLEILPGEPVVPKPMQIFRVIALKSTEEGCFYPLVEIGDKVRKGQLLGVVKNLFGEILQQYTSPEEGEIFCVTRSLAIRPKDLMFGIKYKDRSEGS